MVLPQKTKKKKRDLEASGSSDPLGPCVGPPMVLAMATYAKSTKIRELTALSLPPAPLLRERNDHNDHPWSSYIKHGHWWTTKFNIYLSFITKCSIVAIVVKLLL